jgi:hypothetical protein
MSAQISLKSLMLWLRVVICAKFLKKTRMTIAMTSETKPAKPLTDQEKQFTPLPSEIDPKDAKIKVFMAMQKAKVRFSADKLKR